jgi:type III secretion protein J
MPAKPVLSLALLLASGCAREEVLHGLDEGQANQVLVALAEGGVRGEKRRDEATEGAWRVDVASADAVRAQRLLADRELPRPRPPGFGEVFAKGSIVPTASEERALYLHALSGELARSIEAVDGVLEARVHLALPSEDPLRATPAPPPRASVLVRCRAGAAPRLEALTGGLRLLVAGAVAGLDPGQVAIVVADAPAAAPIAAPARELLLPGALAALSAVLAAAAAGAALLGRRARRLALATRPAGEAAP